MSATTLHEFLTSTGACSFACDRVGTLGFEQAWNTTNRYLWLIWVGKRVGLTAEAAAAEAEIDAEVDRSAPLRTRVRQCCEIARKHLTFAAVWQAALDEGLVAG